MANTAGRPILIVGSTGQVARALVERAGRHGIAVVAHGRPVLDLEKPAGLGSAIVDIRPGNLAMYYPEANVLVPRRLDDRSKTPAFKSIIATVTCSERQLPRLGRPQRS